MVKQTTKMVLSVISAVVIALALLGSTYLLIPNKESLPPFPFPIPSPTGQSYYVGAPTPLPSIIITANGNVSVSAPIIRNRETYTLAEDLINYTLDIQRDNIVVDGAGNSMQGFSNGTEYAQQAILIQDRNNVTITNLKLNQYWQAIFIQNSTNITIDENNLTDIGSTAVYINSANNITIDQNNLNNVATAIEVINSSVSNSNQLSTNRISENNITNAAQGINIGPNSSYIISENNLAYVENAIRTAVNSTVISNNNMINGIIGLDIGGAVKTENGLFIGGSNCIISGNRVENFSSVGIRISGPDNNVFENTVKNASIGVWLETSNWIQTTKNIFYDNNFINDAQNVRVDAPYQANNWDNGRKGNYWSNYKGSDNNNDGIGDTPYIINVNNTDRYPLMVPYGIQMPFLSSQTYAVLLSSGLALAVAIAVGTMLLTRRASRRKR